MNASDAVLKHIDEHLQASLDRLFELIRFPSVGTDPRFNGDCRNAAAWLVRKFDALGFATSLHETTGQPVIIGKYEKPGMSSHVPHILF